MNKSETINNPHVLVIMNWKQRIESVSGLKCIHLSEILNQEKFTLKQLEEAKEEDRLYFKGLIEDINALL